MAALVCRYQLEFDSWQAFVNEGKTRSFLALEAKGSGVAEVRNLPGRCKAVRGSTVYVHLH